MPWKGKSKSRMRKPWKKSKGDREQPYKFKQGKPYRVKPEPFPRELITRCKYVENGNVTLSTATADYASAQTFRLTGLYQPRYSTGDRTVTGYSTLKAMYNNYLVYGAKVQITFYDPSTDGLACGYVLRSTTENSALSKSLTELMAQPLTYTNHLSNTGSQRKSFNFYVSPWSLNGMSKLEFMANRSGLSGSFADDTQPTVPTYFDLFVVNPAAAAGTMKYTLKIIYYVRCFNRNALSYTTYTP